MRALLWPNATHGHFVSISSPILRCEPSFRWFFFICFSFLVSIILPLFSFLFRVGWTLGEESCDSAITVACGDYSMAASFAVGQEVFFCGSGQTLNSENKLEYGARGEVTGTCKKDGTRVEVRFPGNKVSIACLLSQASAVIELFPPCCCKAPPPCTPRFCAVMHVLCCGAVTAERRTRSTAPWRI